MKQNSTFRITLCIFLLITINSALQSQTVTDYDGNVYQTVTIGNQIWIMENLKVTRYSDGTPLINGTGVGELEEIDTTRYFFYYNDDTSNVENYGCLYTWYTAVNQVTGSNSIPSGVQGVCPNGWHIPSDREWQELAICLSMDTSITQSPYGIDINNTIGDLLKENGSSGFEAKFAGVRDLWGGEFGGIGIMSDFISASGFEHSAEDPYVTSIIAYYVMQSEPSLFYHSHNANAGYSVRCIKDTQFSSVKNEESISTCIIYPNPNRDYFYLNTKAVKVNRIDLFTIDGKLIKSEQLNGEKRISISDISNGYYLIKVYSDHEVYVNKLIIE